jgi:hypothetical protein
MQIQSIAAVMGQKEGIGMGPSAGTQDQSGIQFGQDNDGRVEDGDATAENGEDSHGESLPADRFWNTASECYIAADDEGLCMGIELSIWESDKVDIVVIIIILIIEVIDII